MTKKYDFEEIMKDYNSGDERKKGEAMVHMMDAMSKYVHSYIQNSFPTYYNPGTQDYEDMVSEAKLAIITHMGEYDVNKGKPTTFFKQYLKEHICRYINNMPGHGISAYYASMMKKIKKIRNMHPEMDCSPEFLARETGVSMETILKTLEMEQSTQRVYINGNKNEEDGHDGEMLISDFKTPEDAFIIKERKETIQHIMEYILTDKEKKAIAMRFGFFDEECSIKTIAISLECTTDQTKRLIQSALQKLRENPAIKDMGDRKDREELSELIEDFNMSFVDPHKTEDYLNMINQSLEHVGELKF